MVNRRIMKYHPVSKEFQETAKILGLTGNQLIQKYINEGKLPNPTEINRKMNNRTLENLGISNRKEYTNSCSQRRGYKDRAESVKEWQWNKGIHSPMSENEDCASYLGVYITERKIGRKLLPIILGDIQAEMSANNHWFEFIVVGGYKVQFKARTLRYKKGWTGWSFRIDYNSVADYFVLIAFSDRENLNIAHILLIKKGDIVRGKRFYDRETISITNSSKGLLEFQKYDQIEKYDKIKNQIDLSDD